TGRCARARAGRAARRDRRAARRAHSGADAQERDRRLMRAGPFEGNILPFPGTASAARAAPGVAQVGFGRGELMRILDLYGRMVAAGEWRDYAMSFTREVASFAAFRRTADVPQMRVEKRPALRQRQGMWTLFGE